MRCIRSEARGPFGMPNTLTSDRVAVRTIPCAMPNYVYTLNASGIVARQGQLINIMSLSLPHTSIPSSPHNVKEVVKAVIRKMKTVPSDRQVILGNI